MFVLKAIIQTMIDYIGVKFYRATLIKEAWSESHTTSIPLFKKQQILTIHNSNIFQTCVFIYQAKETFLSIWRYFMAILIQLGNPQLSILKNV